jgi:hypothetical protein
MGIPFQVIEGTCSSAMKLHEIGHAIAVAFHVIA